MPGTTVISLLAFGLLASTAAQAAPIAGPSGNAATLAPARTVPDEELDTIRGGFIINGVDVAIGVQMQTYLNGQLALTSVFNWDANGRTQTTSAAPALVLLGTGSAPANTGAGAIAQGLGGGQVYLANGGQTVIWQSAASGIQNGLVNTANGVQATQSINATIALRGYGQFAAINQIGQLGQALGTAVGQAIGH